MGHVLKDPIDLRFADFKPRTIDIEVADMNAASKDVSNIQLAWSSDMSLRPGESIFTLQISNASSVSQHLPE